MTSQSPNPDNPPAFPHDEKSDDGSHHYSHPGMSLRDWFAGQALAGYLSTAAGMEMAEDSYALTARGMYRFADAMLAARKTGGAA